MEILAWAIVSIVAVLILWGLVTIIADNWPESAACVGCIGLVALGLGFCWSISYLVIR